MPSACRRGWHQRCWSLASPAVSVSDVVASAVAAAVAAVVVVTGRTVVGVGGATAGAAAVKTGDDETHAAVAAGARDSNDVDATGI